MYYNREEEGSSQLEHPNIEVLISNFLLEVNDDIGEFNREVQKEWTEEAKALDWIWTKKQLFGLNDSNPSLNMYRNYFDAQCLLRL